jgi:serine/threonine protein kinase
VTSGVAPDPALEDAVVETLERVEATGSLDEAWVRGRFPQRWRDVVETIRLQSRLADDWTVGTLIGPYRVERLIGHGAMGRVYVVSLVAPRVGLAIGALAAVKVIHGHLADRADVRERLLREVDAGRRVRHERVVRMHGFDEVATRTGTARLVVMEHVDGESVRSRLARDGPLPSDACLLAARDAAEGLAAIHDAGVVHRDVKPDNLILRADGRLMVLDLGLARRVDDVNRVSRTGEFVGTLRYAAPEQFLVGGEPDVRCDVYALGATLFELATGRLPWEDDEGASTPAARAILGPLRLRDVLPGAPPALADVVDRCLESHPGRRWGSAREIIERLREESTAVEHELAVPTAPLASRAWGALRDGLLDDRPPVWVLDWGRRAPTSGLPTAVRSRLERSEPTRGVVAMTCLDTPASGFELHERLSSLGDPGSRAGGVVIVEETHRLSADVAASIVPSLRRLHRAGWALLLTQSGTVAPLYAHLHAVGPVRLLDLDEPAIGDNEAPTVRRREPSPSETVVLRAAAALGSPFDPRVLAARLGTSTFELLRTLRRLERDCGLLRWTDGRCVLEHARPPSVLDLAHDRATDRR